MTIGVDVSKETLEVCVERQRQFTVDNSPDGIAKMLSALDPGSTVAMEATGKYHRLLANTAHCLGFHVLVLNPKDVHKYRDSISPRAKTDKVDSGTIADFAQVRNHTPYRPLPPVVEKLRNLVRLRSSLVKQRVAHNNQLSECPDDCEILSPIVDCIGVCVKQIDKKIVEMAKEFASFAPLLDVPGFGTLTSAYMLALLLSGTFRSSDSFVAFIGLDLRVRDSGKKAGKRCLTKRGDPETRRLLYLACTAPGFCNNQAAICREVFSPIASLCTSIGVR